MENNFNDNVVQFLKQEENMLRDKINKCLEGNNFSMYKNLIQAYEKVVELIKKYDWELMYSKYRTEDNNGNLVQQVAVWEQNGDEDIRNHKVWNVVNPNTITIGNKDCNNMYIDYYLNDKAMVFYKNKQYDIDNTKFTVEDVCTYIIKNIIKDDDVSIYINTLDVGATIKDYFEKQGYTIMELSYKNIGCFNKDKN